jgi:hypothetical protein
MRKLIYLAAVAGSLLLVGGCTKDTASTGGIRTKTEMLTAKTWIYNEYFTSYNATNTALVFKLGKANNLRDYSVNRVKFNADGTYQETNENGAQLTGTWQFLNNETQTQVKNSLGTFTSNIIRLSETNYEWYQPSSGTYGEMINQ